MLHSCGVAWRGFGVVMVWSWCGHVVVVVWSWSGHGVVMVWSWYGVLWLGCSVVGVWCGVVMLEVVLVHEVSF